jgi:SAM-dependent methyltransferase
MFEWSRSQIREHGLIAAAQVFWRIGSRRIAGHVTNRLLPGKVMCPCCGWTGRKFYDYSEGGYTGRNIECPRCHSHPRHRALYVWLKEEFKLEERRGAALLCAPEKALESLWESAAKLKTIRVDIESKRGVDLLADLEQLPFASDSIDLIWCHHVLTHVRDDRAAMNELYRVLRAGSGQLMVSVAMNEEPLTEEFDSADGELKGFWRIYGDDFVERLLQSGFAARRLNQQLSGEKCERYGINPWERFYVCVKADTQVSI